MAQHAGVGGFAALLASLMPADSAKKQQVCTQPRSLHKPFECAEFPAVCREVLLADTAMQASG